MDHRILPKCDIFSVMLRMLLILVLVFEMIFSIGSFLQTNLISFASAANEPVLRVLDHKCVNEGEILNCSGQVTNEGTTNSNLVDLIIYLRANDGKITNMIETTTRPFVIASSGHGVYNITVSQSRLSPDWVSSGAFAFSR
ncbi:MAG TPA: hypothetical protein VH796_10865 [Nitrososphaeraceae archaeon]|jgi:hypothetical protein